MSVRTYTAMGKAAANIVGYVGQINQHSAKLKSQGYQPGDQIGLAGVEAEYESYLRGTPGVQKLQVDSAGDVLTTLSTARPFPGDNLRLSIDGHIQMVAEGALQQGMAAAQHTLDKVTGRNFTRRPGSAVVEDPRTGQILALATNPTYDPAEFVGGISQANYQALLNNPSDPLLDRTIQGQYAPGSTFKLVTAMAGLQYGLITPSPPSTTPAASPSATSWPTTTTAPPTASSTCPTRITVSSDNYFNTIGLNLWYGRSKYGEDALQNVAKEFGFGRPYGGPPAQRGSRENPNPAVLPQGSRGRTQGVHPGAVVPRRQRPGCYRPGRGAGHPAAAGQRLCRFRQRRQPVRPAARIDDAEPTTGQVVKPSTPRPCHTASASSRRGGPPS